MALFFLPDTRTRNEDTMTAHTTSQTDDPAHQAECIGDADVPTDAAACVADGEDRENDEDGYGYGV